MKEQLYESYDYPSFMVKLRSILTYQVLLKRKSLSDSKETHKFENI